MIFVPLQQIFFTASAVNPLADVALAAMNPTFARQTGHIRRSRLSVAA
jgi:hypothetical protein